MSSSEQKEFDAGLTARYQFTPQWDAGISLRTFQREIDTAELKNKVNYEMFAFTVGYTFFKKSRADL